MKKTLIGGLSAALAGAAFALNGDGIEHYQDWQFNPVTVKDTNAWANVRGQMDFTRPMHVGDQHQLPRQGLGAQGGRKRDP